MKRILFIVLIAALAALCITAPARAGGEEKAQRIHVIVMAEDQDTEIELTVDEKWRCREILDSGTTIYTYKTKKEQPQVSVLAYGDMLKPEAVKGRSGEWYAVQKVAPPKDGDGGEY